MWEMVGWVTLDLCLIAVSGSLNRWYVIYNHEIGSISDLYTTYILPIGWLYATYHLLREPGNSIDMCSWVNSNFFGSCVPLFFVGRFMAVFSWPPELRMMTPRWSFPEPKDPEIGDLFRVPWFTAGWWRVSQPTPKRYEGWKTPALSRETNGWWILKISPCLEGGLLGRVGWLEMNSFWVQEKKRMGYPPKTNVIVVQPPFLRCYVSFREGVLGKKHVGHLMV